MRTLFPAETGFAQDPELVVVKVDLPPWGQEGMSQLSIQAIKTGVQWRPPAVWMIKHVETCVGTSLGLSVSSFFIVQ